MISVIKLKNVSVWRVENMTLRIIFFNWTSILSWNVFHVISYMTYNLRQAVKSKFVSKYMFIIHFYLGSSEEKSSQLAGVLN